MKIAVPRNLVLQEYFEPVLGRALRTTLALILPLLWGLRYHHMDAAVWAGVSAQLLSNATLRGGYGLRLRIVAGAGILCSMLAFMGMLAGHWVWLSTLLMALLAFAGGYIRQSGDHGPAMVLAGLLLYLLGTDAPGTLSQAIDTGLAVLAGTGLAVLLLVLAWPFIPFSPLRRSVALNWKALADWLDTLASRLPDLTAANTASDLDLKERTIRESISHSMQEMSRRQALRRARTSHISFQMVELRRLASMMAASLYALRNTMEQLIQAEGSVKLHEPYLQRCLESLGHTCYWMSVALVSNREEDAAMALLRIRRAQRFFNLLETSPSGRHWKESQDSLWLHLDQAFRYLEEASQVLHSMRRASGTTAVSFRNFFQDLQHWQHLPAIPIDLNPDSFLFRFAARLSVAMALGEWLFKALHIPHGYWISMTVMIIMQPEFGATYLKAGRRVLGTLAGAVLGGLLIVWHLPIGVSIGLLAACSMLLVVYLNRNYAVSAFFITIQLILLFHVLAPVPWTLAVIRVANTLMGCALALLGGYAFWPLWERKRFPMLFLEALRSNQRYLDRCLDSLTGHRQVFRMEVLEWRREAEMATYHVYDSVRRMSSEPSSKQQGKDRLFAWAGSLVHLNRGITSLVEASRHSTLHDNPQQLLLLRQGFQHHWNHLEQLLEHPSVRGEDQSQNMWILLSASRGDHDVALIQLKRLLEELAALDMLVQDSGPTAQR